MLRPGVAWAIVALLCLCSITNGISCEVQLYDLRAEYRVTPVLDVVPRLSWKIAASQPENAYNLFQDFFQVRLVLLFSSSN